MPEFDEDHPTRVRHPTYTPPARKIGGPAPARGTRDDVAFQATPQMLRGLAREWYLRGFASSGQGFHGESCADAPAVRSLLDAEFNRQWGDRSRE